MAKAEVLGPDSPEPKPEIIDLTGEDTTESESEEGDDASDPSDGPDEDSRAQLRATIATAPEAHLRIVVADLAEKFPAFSRALARKLIAVGPTKRVVIPRWETCAKCCETYDVNDEDEQECTFHPGSLGWGSDYDFEGPMESLHNLDENWSCCDGDEDAQGCVTGKHCVAMPKKRRLSSDVAQGSA
ncbi:hypothetical protein B0H10DRAFT_2130952 [Mycena sp. CBHHK59/15]|nr:hypothetical protein B0H10DRAFT_2130952 [Mycena sp. CBHHK59/15]